jgi:hypothetical protein
VTYDRRSNWAVDELEAFLEPYIPTTDANNGNGERRTTGEGFTFVSPGAVPAHVPRRLELMLREPGGADRSGQVFAFVVTALAFGYADPEITALAECHRATTMKFGSGAAREASRIIAKQRSKHDHVGRWCKDVGCADEPRWMAGEPDERARLGAEPSDLFRRYTMAELLDAERSFQWRVRGMLVDPTYGMVGGERKVLKSYVLTFLGLSVASGESLFGQFPVDEPAPVVVYVGEGGRVPWTNRAERIAAAMGIGKLRDVPLHPLFETAPVTSVRFTETLARDLHEIRPGLVAVDPWYAFHGSQSNASNLFEEGALLTSLSTPCLDAGASLIVASHFNKTGSGRGLDRITQSGGQEWSDTWILLSHRLPPDVDGGHFRLLLEVGSRQWGGSTWELDLELGRFDQELGEFDGAVDWGLRRHRPGHDREDDMAKLTILERLADMPWTFTKTDVIDKSGGKAGKTRAAFDALHKAGKIVAEPIQRGEGDRKVRRSLWALAEEPRPSPEPGSTELVP